MSDSQQRKEKNETKQTMIRKREEKQFPIVLRILLTTRIELKTIRKISDLKQFCARGLWTRNEWISAVREEIRMGG
jgi:hypothetical protein